MDELPQAVFTLRNSSIPLCKFFFEFCTRCCYFLFENKRYFPMKSLNFLNVFEVNSREKPL